MAHRSSSSVRTAPTVESALGAKSKFFGTTPTAGLARSSSRPIDAQSSVMSSESSSYPPFMVTTIAATVVARVFDVGVAAGVSAAELEAILRRRRADLVDGARVSMTATYACFAHCLERTRDPGFPIHVAQSVTLEDYSVLGFALLTSTNADEALERLRRYGHIISDSGTWRSSTQNPLELLWIRSGARTLGHRAANECAIAEIVSGIRRGFGRSLAPRRVFFRHAAPSDVRAHRRFFDAPIEWSAGRDGLLLPPEILTAAPANPNPAMSRYFGDVLERRGNPRATTTERVRMVLVERLASGPPTAAELAPRLGMSERSLRRALDDEGTTFRELLDDLRKTTAREMLDAKKSVTEIAFLLGFSETSALSRAFRRWYGESPRALTAPGRSGTAARTRRARTAAPSAG